MILKGIFQVAYGNKKLQYPRNRLPGWPGAQGTQSNKPFDAGLLHGLNGMGSGCGDQVLGSPERRPEIIGLSRYIKGVDHRLAILNSFFHGFIIIGRSDGDFNREVGQFLRVTGNGGNLIPTLAGLCDNSSTGSSRRAEY